MALASYCCGVFGVDNDPQLFVGEDIFNGDVTTELQNTPYAFHVDVVIAAAAAAVSIDDVQHKDKHMTEQCLKL
eukprot:13362887-Ditylum_brightwellii.AAC.1